LGAAEETRVAWERLRPDLDLQTLDDASFAVLPLVYRTLEAAGVDDPLLPRLKGIYRSTWARNTLLVERLRATADALAAHEVPVLLVGTIGAALRYYPAIGLRPTPSIELLVAEGDAVPAVKALASSGWIARASAGAGRSDPVVLLDDQGNACLLRTMLAPDLPSPDVQTPLWDGAIRFDVPGAQIAALSPSDDLLAAIVVGARRWAAPSIQWIVDAAMIVRAAPDRIDWERLAAVGVAWGQGLRLCDALAYLDRLPDTSVAGGLQALAEHRPSRREQLTYACSARGVGALAEHLAQTSASTSWQTVATLPAFLRRRWRLEHAWQLPAAGTRRAYRRVARRRESAVNHP
jgi:Uncharacterised nucleotidyltransferase